MKLPPKAGASIFININTPLPNRHICANTSYFEEEKTESDIIFTQTYEVFKTGSDDVFFYKDLFASLCFIFFGLALAFNDAYFYFGAMMCACISTTAHRKKWPDPLWATLMMEDISARFESLKRRHFPKKEFSKEDDIGPLPPLEE